MADQMNDVSILSMRPQDITDRNESTAFLFSEVVVDGKEEFHKTSFNNIKMRIKNETITEASIGNVTVDLSNALGTVTMPDV